MRLATACVLVFVATAPAVFWREPAPGPESVAAIAAPSRLLGRQDGIHHVIQFSSDGRRLPKALFASPEDGLRVWPLTRESDRIVDPGSPAGAYGRCLLPRSSQHGLRWPWTRCADGQTQRRRDCAESGYDDAVPGRWGR